jgi:centrin-3
MNSLNPTYAQPNALLRRRPRDLTDEQKAEVREAFEIFDMDKDGALDFHEFKVSPPKVLNVLKL